MRSDGALPMDVAQRNTILSQLAGLIIRRKLTTPARMMLDVIAPLGFLAGQMALFARPFAPPGRWREYMSALEDAEGWATLRDMVDQQ